MPRILKRKVKLHNMDMTCNIPADLTTVNTLQSCTGLQRSQFCLWLKLVVTVPLPPIASLAEETRHTDNLCEQMVSLKRQVRQSPGAVLPDQIDKLLKLIKSLGASESPNDRVSGLNPNTGFYTLQVFVFDYLSFPRP